MCKPLHYNLTVTTIKAQIVILVIWTVSFAELEFYCPSLFVQSVMALLYTKCTVRTILWLNFLVHQTETCHILMMLFFFTAVAPLSAILLTYIDIAGVCKSFKSD